MGRFGVGKQEAWEQERSCCTFHPERGALVSFPFPPGESQPPQSPGLGKQTNKTENGKTEDE